MKLTLRALDPEVQLADFNCGVPALDQWLRRQARQAQRKRLASVWIAFPAEEPDGMVGYYSLAPWQVAFEDCPEVLRERLPRYPLHVTLIARLAVASAHQRQGIGGMLLADALKRAWQADRTVPVQAVIVHAKDERAVDFYRNHGFLSFPQQPLHLFLPMRSIASMFG